MLYRTASRYIVHMDIFEVNWLQVAARLLRLHSCDKRSARSRRLVFATLTLCTPRTHSDTRMDLLLRSGLQASSIACSSSKWFMFRAAECQCRSIDLPWRGVTNSSAGFCILC